MATNIEFSPAIPLPIVFDVQKRIQELRSYLDPTSLQYQPEQQHTNIKAAIKLYEDGKIDGIQQVHIMEGKVVTREEVFKGSAWAWCEGMFYQYAQKFAYGHGPFGPPYHELRMLLRLTPQRGGDGTVHGIIAMNDTGSGLLSLFDTDMQHLGNFWGYAGWHGPIAIQDATGTVTIYPAVLVQVQLVRDDNSPWSDWIEEFAIVKPVVPGLPRLSGAGIRGSLYLATAPGNSFLAVSVTKGGLTSLL
ncbi:MAG: hypothetical protein M1840_004962 [Geoglossum simile]|nr:MAG: hypothetical protein M1840_004962 [Geoglossum simile]